MATKQIFMMHEFKVGMLYHFVRKGLLEFSGKCVKCTPEFLIISFGIAPHGSRFEGAFQEGHPLALKKPFSEYTISEYDDPVTILPKKPAKPSRKKVDKKSK